MKSRAGINKVSRLGFITLMVLSLAGTKVLAAEDFKMWHVTVGETKGKALKIFDEKEERTSAAELISSTDTKKHAEFVKKFTKEPFKFVTAVKEAWTKEKDKNKEAKFEDFKKKMSELISKVKDSEFGTKTKKNAILDLISQLEEKGIDDKEFLKKLFQDSDVVTLWSALGITDKNPNEEAKKEEESEEEKNKEEKKAELPPVGEVDDSALRRTAQAICDQMNALKDNLQKQFGDVNDQLNPLKDALANLLEQQQVPQVDPNQLADRQKKEKGIEDILPGLLANALNDKQDEEVAPPQTAQAPTQAPQSRNDSEDSGLNQPLPEPQQQQPQQIPFMPTPMAQESTIPTLDLPSDSGRQALRDAQDVEFANQTRTPFDASMLATTAAVNPMLAIQQIGGALAKLKPGIATTTAALQDAKDKAGRLDEELEGLKEGARAALSPATKQRQAQLEQDINAKKSELQMLQQSMQSLSPETRDSYTQLLQGKQMEMQQLEQAKAQFNARVEATIEEGNAQVKALKKRSDNLNSVAKRLETQLTTMKQEEAELSSQRNNITMMLQNPQQGGVQNVNGNNGNRLQNFGPRTNMTPRLGSSILSGAVPTNGAVRGPLAK